MAWLKASLHALSHPHFLVRRPGVVTQHHPTAFDEHLSQQPRTPLADPAPPVGLPRLISRSGGAEEKRKGGRTLGRPSPDKSLGGTQLKLYFAFRKPAKTPARPNSFGHQWQGSIPLVCCRMPRVLAARGPGRDGPCPKAPRAHREGWLNTGS